MPNRSYSAGTQFRYGFNGKENDNDVKGTGNQQDYGMRIYDPRIGKFLSVDPLTKNYPMLTPYQFASNCSIAGNDLDGAEFKYYSLTPIQQPVLKNVNGKKLLTFATVGLEATPTNTQNDPVVIAGTVTIGFEINDVPVGVDVDIKFSFTMSELGIKANVVNVNGVNRVLPEGADLEDLPDQDDEYWDGLETQEGYLKRIQIESKKVGDKASLASLPLTPLGYKKGLIKKHFFDEAKNFSKPIQTHHFASNKNKKFTKEFEKIAKKFGLNLDEDWNKRRLPHQGRHPNKYHEFVLRRMKRASEEAGTSKSKFLQLFEKYIIDPIMKDPKKLTKQGW